MQGGANYSLREMALSWKGRSMPYLSWSEFVVCTKGFNVVLCCT